MLKSIRQFRIPCDLPQAIIMHVCAHLSDHFPSVLGRKPGPHNPGSGKKERALLIHDGYPSTERKSFSTLENKKPDLGGSGFRLVVGVLNNPIIAHSEIKASGFPLGAETSMSNLPVGSGFIKLKREAIELLTDDPDAFLLLTLIALRTKRSDSKIVKCKLKIGEALIGDYKCIGFTEKKYRRAIQKLKEGGLAAFKGTNKGTIATLSDSGLYDINLETEGRTKGRTNRGLRADKGADKSLPSLSTEEIKNERKKKESARNSTFFGRFVKLENDEYETLASKFGKPELDAMIEKINDHCESTGTTYKGFAATIRNWFRREKTMPITPAATKPESVLAFLQDKLGMDRVEDRFGTVEVTSPQGYIIQKFDKKDIQSAKKWYAERYEKVINGTT